MLILFHHYENELNLLTLLVPHIAWFSETGCFKRKLLGVNYGKANAGNSLGKGMTKTFTDIINTCNTISKILVLETDRILKMIGN